MEYTPVVLKTNPEYPTFPYSPSKNYPEYLFDDYSPTPNYVYEGIREIFKLNNLDKENFGKENWNPLKSFISPGDTVLLKPNLVNDFNPIDSNIESLVTHTSVLRAVMDYIILALNGKGKIIIGDAPIQGCDFENLKKKTKLEELLNFYKNKGITIPMEIKDWRLTIFNRAKLLEKIFKSSLQKSFDLDFQKVTLINLGKESLFEEIPYRYKNFRVTSYNSDLLIKHHCENKHEYLISNDIFESNVIFNISKFKTHKLAGLTGALKNLIGVNAHKEFLPHYTRGSLSEGGDAYPNKCFVKKIYEDIYDIFWKGYTKRNWFSNRILKLVLKLVYKLSFLSCPDKIYYGTWIGNDTIWRTILDLNKIIYFYDLKNKKISSKIQRKIINITDGIIAGEGNGPLTPRRKLAGIITFSLNPLLNDLILCTLMGFNYKKIPTIYQGLFNYKSPYFYKGNQEEIEILFTRRENAFLPEKIKLNNLPNLNFIPPKNWEEVKK
jgi:uncharacterized protein (DUF362 family)